MGILSGAMTVRRFKVIGELPNQGLTDHLRACLQDYAFIESPIEVGKEEREGWVQVHNLLDTDFEDLNKWSYGELVIVALRVDKKTLPAKLFKAHVDKRVRAWCEQHNVERCPRATKDEISEALESEWLRRALPRVSLTEICWNTSEGYCLVHSLSDGVAERVRKRFMQSFGLKLVPWSPLEFVVAEGDREALLETAPTSFRGGR